MKNTITTSVQQLFADKTMFGSLLLLVIGAVLFSIYFIVNISPSELQLNTHYTSYGQEHFYREPWTYLLSFVGFGILLGLVHPVIAAKLYLQRGRQVALLFCWTSIIVLLIAARLLYEIIKVAALSYV